MRCRLRCPGQAAPPSAEDEEARQAGCDARPAFHRDPAFPVDGASLLSVGRHLVPPGVEAGRVDGFSVRLFRVSCLAEARQREGRLRCSPRDILRANQATCFGAGLRSKPLRKCRAETDNTETQRREDDELCHVEFL